MFDAVFKGRLVQGADLVRGSVGVTGGRIVAVARDLAGREVHDFGERLLLPGGIDPHVHFRDPGFPEKEDFATGSLSAAFGGVTCVLDMPNTKPATITREAFEQKRAIAQAKSYVDFGIFAGLTGDAASLALLEHATAMKIYLGSTTGDLLVERMDLVAAALQASARYGKTIAVHAEDESCMRAHKAHVAGRTDWLAHEDSRPNACEQEAIEKVLALPRPAGARLHVCHLSTAEGLALVRNSDATCEVCPHHLFFTKEDLAKGGAFKMNPPLRSGADAEALWQGLRWGEVDCLASDHAPHTPGEKRVGVWECPSGVPGVETMIPLLVKAALDGRMPWSRLQAASSTRAAEIYGLPKGRLAPGYDADIAVYDLRRVTRIEPSRLHSRAGWTPFEGLSAVFPSDVFVRGRAVIRDRVLVGEQGRAVYQGGNGPRPATG